MSNHISYGDLRYNEVSMKAAHNSYQRDETLVQQVEWSADKPYNGGCRALELDISQSDDGEQWSVGHKESYDVHYRQLSQFLNELCVWSSKNRGHDVITLYLDLKHVVGDFAQKLDDHIRDFLHVGVITSVYCPWELMGDAPSLPAGAEMNGWPTIEQLRGRFILCLTGDKQAKELYASTHPRGRLCFTDKDVNDTDKNDPESDSCVFYDYNLFFAHRETWKRVFQRLAGSRKAILRGYVLNGEALWNAALENGCHLLATDKISNHPWAKVGDSPFVRLKPL